MTLSDLDFTATQAMYGLMITSRVNWMTAEDAEKNALAVASFDMAERMLAESKKRKATNGG